MTIFKLPSRFIAAAGAVVLLAAAPSATQAQQFSPAQRDEIGNIIKDYLLKNPELLQEVMEELDKRQTTAKAESRQSAIKTLAGTLFNSPRQVVLGNPKGDVTFVEFFDYNCGFCKTAMNDMLTLMKDDTKLKVVLKEFPVLGEDSIAAAQVAVAVNMQDKTGKKYFEFHRKLLGGRGRANGARALAVAREIGLDVARIEKDMKSDEVRKTLQESFNLARALGLNGTPSYVIGSEVVEGARGLDTLKEAINTTRCGKPTC